MCGNKGVQFETNYAQIIPNKLRKIKTGSRTTLYPRIDSDNFERNCNIPANNVIGLQCRVFSTFNRNSNGPIANSYAFKIGVLRWGT